MAFSKNINELISEDTTGLLHMHASWQRVTLEDVVDVLNGYAFPSSGFNTGHGLPLIRIRDIVSGKTDTTYEGPYNDTYLVNNGDLLVGMDGDFNSAFWQSGIALLNQRVCKLSAMEHFYNRKFLAYVLPGYLKAINEHTSAQTVKHLSSKTIQSIPLPLPPYEEQNRISEKLDQVFSELDAGVAELKAAQVKLGQYRLSLLKDAVDGALTAQWRKENAGKVTETGEELLARILKQRRTQWEQQKLAEFQAKGQTPSKGWQAKYSEPEQPDTRDLPKLPDGWVWSSVDQLVYESSYGSSVKCNYGTGNTPVLRIPNIINKSINLEDIKESVESLDIQDFKYLQPGDILVVRTNGSLSLMGQTALINSIPQGYYFASYLLRLRPTLPKTLPKWMDLYFSSEVARNWIEGQASSSAGQNNISLSKFSKLFVPLPSIKEQAHIIQQASFEFESVDRQLESLLLGIKQSEVQRKNVLKLALSGQLVPQDPNDEPASVLLKKISAKREAQAKLPKPKKMPRIARAKGNDMTTLKEALAASGDWIDAQDAFKQCGIVDGTATDRIEAIYNELKRLEQNGEVQLKRVNGYDQLKLGNKAN
ncbi:MAG: restriction endonuclease subunit S [Gammaproteobacteria bacterium HGW-Gammaproteobacteria-15]|nr:MAG: restriction endonuclease subunit S [Gammaproteobacteria bacterium HGW-Gammaproteobacteria-15]